MIKLFISFLLVLFITTNSHAQNNSRTLTGIVTNSDDDAPLEGVSIFIKGSASSSGTQADGIYYIKVKPTDSVIVFQLDGYEKREVKIKAGNEINIELHKAAPTVKVTTLLLHNQYTIVNASIQRRKYT